MLKSIKCDQAVRAVSGFSLVEVTLAIGIAAFCFIAVIGIVPVGVQTNRNATSQTAATNIMAAVVTDLRATSKTKFGSGQFGFTIPSNHNSGAPPDCQPCAGCWDSQTQTRYFDASGKSRNFNNLRVPTNSRAPGKSMKAWFETKFMDSRFPLMQP